MATTTSTNATASVPSITPPNGCVVPLGGQGVVDEAATSTIGSVSCVRGHGVGLLGTLGGTRTPSLLVRSSRRGFSHRVPRSSNVHHFPGVTLISLTIEQTQPLGQ